MSVLYVTGSDVHVTLSSKHLHIRKAVSGKELLVRKIPFSAVSRLCVVGRVRVSMRTVEQMLQQGIPVLLYSAQGRLSGSFVPRLDADATLRIHQYQQAGSEAAFLLARRLVQAKIRNQRRVLQRLSNAHAFDAGKALLHLGGLSKAALESDTVAQLRGLEGAAARHYFPALAKAFPEQIPFSGRSRRPPRDPANALLSWTYTMVTGEVRGALAGCGLDPCIGILHAISYNRPALALDLMEPLRAPLCDRLVLRLFNLKMLQPRDFEIRGEQGGVFLKREAMRNYFRHYEACMTGCGGGTAWREAIRAMAVSYAAQLKGTGTFAPVTMK